MLLFAAFAVLLLPAATVRADDAIADEAAEVVAGLYRALVEVAALEPTPELASRAELLGPTIVASHDLPRMGRLTVSRQFWREFDPAEREAYLEAFERLTVATYASRFAGITADVFEIVAAEVIADNQVDVHGVIHRSEENGGDVSMDYSLYRDAERFRIVIIRSDGVDELNIMTSNNFDILSSGGTLDEVIEALEQQIEAL